MRKEIKVLLAINVLTSVYALGRLGFAWLNARDPKALEKEVTDIFEKNVDAIVTDLKLAQRPTLVFSNDTSTAVMSTRHTYCSTGFIVKTITSTEAEYAISVYLKNISNLFIQYAFLSFNKKEIHEALIRQLILHECRHIWQAQGDFYIGQTIDNFSTFFKGYGESASETDANDYAISKAKDKKEKALFRHVKAIQDNHDKLFKSNKDINATCQEVRKTWKPLFGFLF